MVIPRVEWMIMGFVALAAQPQIQGQKSSPVLEFLQMQVEPTYLGFFQAEKLC